MTLDYLSSARARVSAIILGLGLAACGGDDSGTVTVELAFPSPIIENQTATVHAWVLTRNDGQTEEGETPPDDPAAARAAVATWERAGCTWWLETRWELPHESEQRLREVRERLAAGPPHPG